MSLEAFPPSRKRVALLTSVLIVFLFGIWIVFRSDVPGLPISAAADNPNEPGHAAQAPTETPVGRSTMKETFVLLSVVGPSRQPLPATTIRSQDFAVTTGADGKALISAATAEITVCNPKFAPAVVRIEEADRIAGHREIVLRSGCRLYGKVLTWGGVPVEKARVTVSRGGVASADVQSSECAQDIAPSKHGGVVYRVQTLTDVDGRFSFEGLAAGIHTVVWSKWGCVPFHEGPDKTTYGARNVEVREDRPTEATLEMQRLFAAVACVSNKTELPDEVFAGLVWISFGYPKGLADLPPAQLSTRLEVQESLRIRAGDHAVVVPIVARETSRLPDIWQGLITVESLGKVLASVPFVFWPVSSLEGLPVVNVPVALDLPTGTLVVRSSNSTTIRRTGKDGFMFFSRGNETGVQELRVPLGKYRIAIADGIFDTDKREVTAVVSAGAPTVARLDGEDKESGVLAIRVCDAAGRPTSAYFLSIDHAGHDRLFAGAQNPGGIVIPCEFGEYMIRLYDLQFTPIQQVTAEVKSSVETSVILGY
jgi:hypothetical protein